MHAVGQKIVHERWLQRDDDAREGVFPEFRVPARERAGRDIVGTAGAGRLHDICGTHAAARINLQRLSQTRMKVPESLP